MKNRQIIIDADMKIPLEYARKDVEYSTGKKYNADNPSHYSEWAYALTVARYKEGDIVSEGEFMIQLEVSKQEQIICKLVDGGLMELVLCDDGSVGYKVTEKGEQVVKNNKR